MGVSLGRKHFRARAGQKVDVNYAFVSGAGQLDVVVMRNATLFNTPAIDTPPVWKQTAYAPGSWRATVWIPAEGSYRVHVWPKPQRGQSLTCDISWKVH
jgi:hypothetical protein